ncbi:L-type lectin-domain containing receptor kinase VIII.1-like [Andrographis paniculata]|uniref:L-type lectin-domain containing receptor kinase VIII.1-like n=1 Tax=Andrographis paniculata TaxID=175694 RepID=UPI0021E83825|nr:L-type lectin-domain containing receptor kinase VIII.1-like [Andrographis paniculata]
MAIIRLPFHLFLSSWLFFVDIFLAHGSGSNSGPVINITKHISFPNFSPTNPLPDITLLGSAAISPQSGCLQIPGNNREYAAGRALYSSPIRLLPASFSTTFSFQINSSDSTSGGLSFIIVPDELTIGRPGPWLGMMNDACEDEYKIVGVEFDTRKNPEFGDPNDNHIGINLGSIVSKKTVNAGDIGIDLDDRSVLRTWITYDGNRQFLQIHLGHDGASLPSKPVYSGYLDLSPYLNEYMFIGFSGSTGNSHTQINSICSWNFSSISQASLRYPSSDSCANRIAVSDDDDQNIPHKAPSSFYIFLAVVALVLIIMINLYFNGKRKSTGDDSEVIPEKKVSLRPPNRARKFNLAEISTATRGFGDLQALGSDGISVTYKGTLFNGCNVAVKRFSPEIVNVRERGILQRRMIKEVKAIGKIRHPNLVPVRGWCFDHGEAIVVYDFVPNGSLDQWLLGFGVLPWIRRLKIVKDVAEALRYLHSRGLAHRNVKASSVFLDVSFRAMVGDLGFVLEAAESAVNQRVDVFEFGVLALEVVSGRVGEGAEEVLNEAWAAHESGEKGMIVDRRMGPAAEQAVAVVEIGLMCTLNESKGRPTMEEVVEYLNGERRAAAEELPPTRPVSLFPYGSSSTALCSGYSCAPLPFK